jgi:hypothetical protein
MLDVLLTIDVEVWPSHPGWPNERLPLDWHNGNTAYERCVLGRTSSGEYGLPFLLQSLRARDLHAVFFVEALASSVTGESQLRNTVALIQSYDQEVQLHVHPEWLSEIATPGLPARHGARLAEFNLAEQTAIIGHALENLRLAGATDVCAVRAGNMQGNADTARAARAVGLGWDLSADPARGTAAWLDAPRDRRDEVARVVPLSFVEDYTGHHRAAQLAALSLRELQHALLQAERRAWNVFVILSHSFELVKRSRSLPDVLHLRRWNGLCDFLAANRNSFRTIGCNDLTDKHAAWPLTSTLRTNPLHTLVRYGEQLTNLT